MSPAAESARVRPFLFSVEKIARWGILLLESNVCDLMKTAVTITLILSLLATSAALACDKTKTKHAKKINSTAVEKAKNSQTAPAEQKGGGLLTGSYIKQNVKRRGIITDCANQVIVLDRDSIERSGASDVKQLLSHHGIH